jgi:hypothetical protein
MVTEPTEPPVTVVWQLGTPPTVERAQVAEAGSVTLPVPPVWEKLTVSPEMMPPQPDTVAVQGEESPISNCIAPSARGGGHETEVAVVPWVTVTLASPELAASFASPGYDA